jgi:hypothetical protein
MQERHERYTKGKGKVKWRLVTQQNLEEKVVRVGC